MTTVDWARRFKACGVRLKVHPDVHIEHPELVQVGDHVEIGKGFYCCDSPRLDIRSRVTFMPGCFLQGAGRLKVGDDVTFFPGTYIATGGESGIVSVGSGSHFAPGCTLYGAGELVIGEYCNVASHVVLTTVGHDPIRREVPMGVAAPKILPIVVESDVWIGANATIVSGVRIGEGGIIGANAVVTRDTEPFSLYAGVPAQLKKRRAWADRQQ